MTDTEKLNAIKRYVQDMSPIFRPALLLSEKDQAHNDGYDHAMHQAQKDLLELLEDH